MKYVTVDLTLVSPGVMQSAVFILLVAMSFQILDTLAKLLIFNVILNFLFLYKLIHLFVF